MIEFKTTQGTKVIRLDNPRCNCYLILAQDQAILVDTSTTANLKSIEKQIMQVGVTKINAIIQTHQHTDHVQNTAYFQNKYHCPVYIHASECEYLQQGHCKMPQGTNPWGKLISWAQSSFHVFETFEPVENVIPIDTHLSNSVFPDEITILPTPGHSCGSISVLVDHEIACVGDAMVHVGKTIYPPFADDEKTLKDSWQVLANTSCNLFLPAHGKEVAGDFFRTKIHAI